jgi:uncharacterized DUF497 family protein
MDFEFDPDKSSANLAKHGIDFEAAQALWLDDRRIEAGVVIRGEEERQLVVGSIDDRLWTAVVTRRGDALRIISVRRARSREEEEYFR